MGPCKLARLRKPGAIPVFQTPFLRSKDAPSRCWPSMATARAWSSVSTATLVVVNYRYEPFQQSGPIHLLHGVHVDSPDAAVARRVADKTKMAGHASREELSMKASDSFLLLGSKRCPVLGPTRNLRRAPRAEARVCPIPPARARIICATDRPRRRRRRRRVDHVAHTENRIVDGQRGL